MGFVFSSTPGAVSIEHAYHISGALPRLDISRSQLNRLNKERMYLGTATERKINQRVTVTGKLIGHPMPLRKRNDAVGARLSFHKIFILQ